MIGAKIKQKYNLKNDIIFKAFFSRKGNEIFLIDFLEALLNIKINQWLVFLDDSDKEAVKMAERKNNTLKKARKEIDYLTGDDAIRRLADLREKWEMDYVTGIECAEEKGIAKGREEGIKEGIKEGKNEGKKQKQIEITKNLLKMGMKISEISKATGLTIEEIEQINKN